MHISLESKDGGVAIITLDGRLDLLTSADVKRELGSAVDGGHRRLIVDLGGVTFIDSSGLGTLIGGLKLTRQAGGDLRIARPTDQARLVLQLTTLDRVLRPYTSVEEAAAGY